MEENDSDLLVRYRKGDVDSLERLVEKYRRRLFAFILNSVSERDAAEEIFQEVWFRAIRKIGTYSERNLLGWLIRISRNVIIDRWRRKKPNVSLDEENENGVNMAERVAAPGQDPAQASEAKEVAARVSEAIGRLPPEQKDVVLMRITADLPFKEIARIQGVSINTALARMQYGLAKIRAELQDYDNGGNESELRNCAQVHAPVRLR